MFGRSHTAAPLRCKMSLFFHFKCSVTVAHFYMSTENNVPTVHHGPWSSVKDVKVDYISQYTPDVPHALQIYYYHMLEQLTVEFMNTQ